MALNWMWPSAETDGPLSLSLSLSLTKSSAHARPGFSENIYCPSSCVEPRCQMIRDVNLDPGTLSVPVCSGWICPGPSVRTSCVTSHTALIGPDHWLWWWSSWSRVTQLWLPMIEMMMSPWPHVRTPLVSCLCTVCFNFPGSSSSFSVHLQGQAQVVLVVVVVGKWVGLTLGKEQSGVFKCLGIDTTQSIKFTRTKI